MQPAREVYVDSYEAEGDGWEPAPARPSPVGVWLRQANLLARRKAEDEALLQQYARDEDGGRYMREARAFVNHVRGDVGPRAVIENLTVRPLPNGIEIGVCYFEPPDDNAPEPPRQTRTSLADLPVVAHVDAPTTSTARHAPESGFRGHGLPLTDARPAARLGAVRQSADLQPRHAQAAG